MSPNPARSAATSVDLSRVSEAEDGSIRWLPDDAEELDSITWKISGIDYEAQNHPVVVIGYVGCEDIKYYVVLLCSSTYNNNQKSLTIVWKDSNGDITNFNCSCSTSPSGPTLFGEPGQKLDRHTHVKTEKAYLVSPRMLRKDLHAVGKPRLDGPSRNILFQHSQTAIETLKSRAELSEILEFSMWYTLPEPTEGIEPQTSSETWNTVKRVETLGSEAEASSSNQESDSSGSASSGNGEKSSGSSYFDAQEQLQA